MANTLLNIYTIPQRVPAGIQAVYIAPYNQGGTYSYPGSSISPFVLDGTSTIASPSTFTYAGVGFTSSGFGSVVGTIGTTPTFTKFEQRLEQGSYLESGVYGENGSYGVSQKLEITLEGYDQNTKNNIAVLNKGSWRAIVLDQNGNYILMGYQNPVLITTSDGGLGKAYGDGVKTTLTFEVKEINPAPSVNYQVAVGLQLS